MRFRRQVFMALALIFALLTSALPAAAAGPLDGHFIVVLHDGDEDVGDVAQTILGGETTGPAILQGWRSFAARISQRSVEALRSDPRVAAVVPDDVVSLNLPSLSRFFPFWPVRSNAAATAQRIPTGVQRIGLNFSNNGTGVGVAILDSGIDLSHPDLASAIRGQVTFVPGTKNANDDNGHGSHVAGTIAARDNGVGVRGVASGVSLYAVKVLDSKGSARISTVLQGLEWVRNNAEALNIRVVNLSMGGRGRDDGNCGRTNGDVLHRAICDLVASGVTVVVAAGNDGGDVSRQIPAAYPEVVAVSALVDTDGKAGGSGGPSFYGLDDTFASFSNYGSAVALAAPGVAIYSTYRGGGYQSLNGTSMAAPHVTGAAALYVAAHPTAGPAEVKQALVAAGESAGRGHFDTSGRHREPVVLAGAL